MMNFYKNKACKAPKTPPLEEMQAFKGRFFENLSVIRRVIPAQAGIQTTAPKSWIPVQAGMTEAALSSKKEKPASKRGGRKDVAASAFRKTTAFGRKKIENSEHRVDCSPVGNARYIHLVPFKGGIFKRFAFLVTALVFLFQISALKADKKVVIIAGSGGEIEFVERFFEQGAMISALLIDRYSYEKDDVFLFTEQAPDTFDLHPENTAQNIQTRFEELSKDLKTDDQLLVFILGHGSFDGEWAKVNITGPDLRDVDFANVFDKLPTQKVLFINMASASGPFLEKLSREERVIVTATRNGMERNITRFADHFIDALRKDNEADLNKDGILSVTEAFIFTRDNLISEYDQKKELRAEHPLLDDDGDGVGSETPDLLTGDGALASSFYFQQERRAQFAGTSDSTRAAAQPASPEKQAILAKVKALQEKKSEMAEEDFYKELEKLMLELAKLNTQERN